MSEKKPKKFLGVELYSNIVEQVHDLAEMKRVSEETAVGILILNELRQLHWHADRFDVAMFKPPEESTAKKSVLSKKKAS